MKQRSELENFSLASLDDWEIGHSRFHLGLSRYWGLRVVFFLTALGWGMLGATASPICPSEARSALMVIYVPPPLAQANLTSDADLLFQDGMQLFHEGTTESLREAMPLFEAAAQQYQQQNNQEKEALALSVLGATHNLLENRQAALTAYEQSLSLWQALGEQSGEAVILNNIGLVYYTLGDYQRALDYHNQALPMRRAVGDRTGEADTLYSIGVVYDDLGDYQRALNYYQQALPLFREVGDRAGEAVILHNIGTVYDDLGDYQQASEYYDQALPLRQAVGDRAGEASTLNGIGNVYYALGERQQALNYFNQALLLRRAVGDRTGEAVTLNSIGNVYYALGERQQALNYFNQALLLRRAVGDRTGEATTLSGIGGSYHALGERQRALNYFNQALLLRRAVGDRAGEAYTLNGIGVIYQDSRDYQQALNYFNQALLLFREVGERVGEAATLTNIGAVYSGLGDHQQALDYYQQALPAFRAVGDRVGEAATLNGIGRVYNSLDERQRALNYYNQALLLSQAVGDRSGEASILIGRAWSYRQDNNLANALTDVTAAVKIIEDLRDSIQDDALRTTYFSAVQHYYLLQIDLLMQLHQQDPEAGYDRMAFDTSERTRARSLIELLAESRIDFSADSDDPQVAALVQQEQSLQQQRADQEQLLIQRLNQATTDAERTTIRSEVTDEFNRLGRELDAVVAQLRQVYPAYANLQYPEPLTVKEVQQQVLDADTVLLQYALVNEQSYLFVVTFDSFHSYILPDQREIATIAERFVNQIEQSTCVDASNPAGCIDFSIARAGHPLYEQILAPAAEHIAGKRLLVAADGILHYTPFAALPLPDTDGYQPLLTQHEVVMTPSVTTLTVQRNIADERSPAPNTVALLADPVFTREDERVSQVQPTSTPEATRPTANETDIDLNLDRSALERAACLPDDWKRLPYTAAEAEAILALDPDAASLSALAFDANQDWLLDSPLAQYRFLHLATHGCLDAQNPELSGLVLSQITPQGTDHPDGFLRLHEIFNLNLNADLVVLSACQTGRGESIRGEGIVGMTRGFMFAGAEQVVVSLWNVNDQATAELMDQFYQNMLASDKTPATSLRQAQLALWDEYQDPRLWAAFTLQGDW